MAKSPEDIEELKFYVQIGITIVLGFFSLYLIATQNQDNQCVKWAYGIIGIIIGYWLK